MCERWRRGRRPGGKPPPSPDCWAAARITTIKNARWPRAAAVGALAGREDPEVTGRLLDRLDDPDRYVRAVAAQALAGREDPAVAEGLLSCLDHSDRDLQVAAVRALAGHKDPGVTGRL